MPTEKLPHLARELARIDRLLHESVAPDREAGLLVTLGRDGDDGNAVERRLAAKAQRDLVAIQPRDVEIDQHQIGALRDREAYAFKAVRGVDHLDALRGQELSHEEAISGIVFDVQNTRHGDLPANIA